MEKRPGQAHVQYGDVRGEVAGDISDSDQNSLQEAAAKLGFDRPGYVVGISLYSGESYPSEDSVSVTFQVIDHPDVEFGADTIKAYLAEHAGVLPVTEFTSTVPITEVLRHFKRLQISMFSRDLAPRALEVTEGEDLRGES